MISGYGLGYGVKSFIGPIKAMYTFRDLEEGELFISIGYWF
ncbi:hypothetical protein [Aquimarina pacifica]